MTGRTVESTSTRQTEALAEQIAGRLAGGALITLSGELGAGKTVFVRGLAKGLRTPPGVVVTSPTYVLQHIYRGGRLTLYHIDAYRLAGGGDELEASGLGECFSDPAGVVCLEWPERISDWRWPVDYLRVQIEHIDPERRRFTFDPTGPLSASWIGALP